MLKENQTVITGESDASIKRLFAAGAHFGYSRTRNHPKTRDFIFAYKNRSAIIDLEKTIAALNRAKEFLAELGRQNKPILLVGNKDEARAAVARAGEQLGMPYVASRWLGGTLTNFSQIKLRLDRLAELKTKREQGELAVYTKKEQLGFDQEIEKLERYLGSLAGLTNLPAAVLVVDSNHEAIVVKEAKQKNIPVISLSNTDCDLRGIAYPIVVNDANVASIKLVLDELVAAYENGKSAAAATAAAAPAPASLAL